MKRLSCVVLWFAALGGCAQIEVPKLSIVKDDPSLTLFDARFPGAASAQDRVSQQPTQSYLLQHRALGTAEHSHIDDYTNAVLKRLQRTLPGAPAEARVYVTPTTEFSAASYEDGGIYIPYKVFSALESEDELAALIAHEYAHVLLAHHKTNWLDTASGLLYSAGKMYIGQRKADLVENDLLRMLAINEAGLGLSQIGLIPGLTRAQEDEADRLGVDLMIRAGYSYVGAHKLLTRIKTWDDITRAQREARRQDYVRLFKSSDNSALAKALDGQVDKLEDQVTKLLAQWSRHHDAGETRIDSLRSYLKQHYDDANRPPLRVAEYQSVMGTSNARHFFSGLDQAHHSSLALMKQDRKSAMTYARQAERSPASSAAYSRHVLINSLTVNGRGRDAVTALEELVSGDRALYNDNLLLVEVLRKQDPERALALAQRSYDRFGEPADLLPDLITLNKQLNRNWFVMKFYGVCAAKAMAATDNALLDSCNKAKG